jgi:hypothetical protein
MIICLKFKNSYKAKKKNDCAKFYGRKIKCFFIFDRKPTRFVQLLKRTKNSVFAPSRENINCHSVRFQETLRLIAKKIVILRENLSRNI